MADWYFGSYPRCGFKRFFVIFTHVHYKLTSYQGLFLHFVPTPKYCDQFMILRYLPFKRILSFRFFILFDKVSIKTDADAPKTMATKIEEAIIPFDMTAIRYSSRMLLPTASKRNYITLKKVS